MTDIVEMVDLHDIQLRDHAMRLDDHDEVLYGNDRTRTDGLVVSNQRFQMQIEQKIDRLVLVTYGLVLAIAILAVTVAVAVLA